MRRNWRWLAGEGSL